MALIQTLEEAKRTRLSELMSDDKSALSPDLTCFLCSETVDLPLVFWSGGGGVRVWHTECIGPHARKLQAEAWRIEDSSRLRPARSPNSFTPRTVTPQPKFDAALPGVSTGARPLARHDAYVQAALRSELDRVLSTVEGGRNCQLNESAFALGTLVGAGLLEAPMAAQALAQAGLATGLTQKEVEATVRSGLQAGMKKPRQVQ